MPSQALPIDFARLQPYLEIIDVHIWSSRFISRILYRNKQICSVHMEMETAFEIKTTDLCRM